jgi:hypothetical protein
MLSGDEAWVALPASAEADLAMSEGVVTNLARSGPWFDLG